MASASGGLVVWDRVGWVSLAAKPVIFSAPAMPPDKAVLARAAVAGREAVLAEAVLEAEEAGRVAASAVAVAEVADSEGREVQAAPAAGLR